ncbi:MAG: hypothetical protein HZC12_04245 [Nitrospirae bacterium]|nr:hypothetical protein [Nitrospirota bacterium]
MSGNNDLLSFPCKLESRLGGGHAPLSCSACRGKEGGGSGRLASLLLCGDKEKNIVDFKMGGIVCIKRFEDGHWSLEWMIIPEVIT